MFPRDASFVRALSAALSLGLGCAVVGCDDVGDNVAFVRGEVRVSGVGQFAHVVTIDDQADVTDLSGSFAATRIPLGPQEIEILSPIDGEICLVVTVETAEPVTIVNFNLERANGQISGSVDTATNGPGESIAIAAFIPPADCF